MPYCFMSVEKIKTPGSFQNKMKHNFRLEDTPNANPEELYLNEELIKMPEGKTYYDIFKQKMGAIGHIPRKNAVLGMEVLMSYNKRDIPEDFDYDKWKELNVEWLKDTFGEDNVISAVVHRDEAGTNHMHAIVLPIVDDKLNAKHFLPGRAGMVELQTSYGKKMSEVGLKRGLEHSKAKHKDIRRFYDELNKTLEKELPHPKRGEKVEEYRERANEYYTRANLHHLDEINKMQRKIDEASTKAYSVSLDEKVNVQGEWKKIDEEKRRLKKKREEMKAIEDKIAMDNKKIHNFDLITNGLKNYPDREYAEQLAEKINRLIRWENGNEKNAPENIITNQDQENITEEQPEEPKAR